MGKPELNYLPTKSYLESNFAMFFLSHPVAYTTLFYNLCISACLTPLSCLVL